MILALIVAFGGLVCIALGVVIFLDDDENSIKFLGFIPIFMGIVLFLGVKESIDDAYEAYVYETPEFVNKETGERSIPDSAAIFYLIDSQWVKIESYKAEKK